MDLYPSLSETLVRLVLAAGFGGLLGFEREWRQKPAGLRTHMMVSLGSATFSLVALDMYSQIAPISSQTVQVDPIRIMEGVISGIGFLGAGSIIRAGGRVEGLTTAGSLWLAGAIGLSVGGGLYILSAVAIATALVILIGVGALVRRFPVK